MHARICTLTPDRNDLSHNARSLPYPRHRNPPTRGPYFLRTAAPAHLLAAPYWVAPSDRRSHDQVPIMSHDVTSRQVVPNRLPTKMSTTAKMPPCDPAIPGIL
ncbi:uncharacterized protein CANTADRAFT_313392 [Suhomyces tanzawaensis NRRL Y-17324]|uniref:Uncharacterized protein n=1 Tax=Suhomyces tanzawaensis NRRL Y-17324 TaxID=984487 RepID=A0A1E4SDG6_9ASCO|nr:uncharacterized protein CANTADRAFT_313392 [Suhomyces tanzawaensis NRRL Y-17324]ODV77523.1 hypothetical protein CANTADRAFT_313392 [Suhomyces tanzawaensis NRRL Y-17324]